MIRSLVFAAVAWIALGHAQSQPVFRGRGDTVRVFATVLDHDGRLVTTLGLFGFEPESRRMRLEAVHPGVTVEEVRAETPFELAVAERVETTAPISERELDVLRALDPARQFIG